MTQNVQKGWILSSMMLLSLAGCQEKRKASSTDTPTTDPGTSTPSTPATPTTPGRFLYVASGACYGGDATAGALAAGSNTISRYNVDTGAFDDIIVDYNTFGFGDAPAGIADYDNDHLLVLVENTGGRRIDLLNKKTGATSIFLTNSNLGGVVRSLTKTADGSFLVSKSTAVEKFNANKVRVTAGTNPYINAPAAPCATSTTLISDVAEISVSTGTKLVYTHAAATPNNRIGVINGLGYNVAGDCIAGVTVPTTTALPTSLITLAGSQHVLVAAGSATNTSNFIQSYVVNVTTGVIPAPTAAWTDFAYVTAPSAMVEDPSSGYVFVASARATHNSVERFTYNTTTKALTRVAPTFLQNSVLTRCISGLVIGN